MNREGDETGAPESTGGVDRRAFLRMVAGAATGAAVVGGIPDIAAAQTGPRAQMGMSTCAAAWRASLHADERDPQRHRPLSLVYERHADRGGACADGRRRVRNVQADQRPGERTERLRGRWECHPHGGSTVSVHDKWRRQFSFQLQSGQRRPAHTAGRQAHGEPRRRKERHRQITGLCPFEGHPVRAALVRPRSSPADVRRRPGKLTARPERYTANTKDKTDRVPTMAVLSPDGKFLLVGTTFDVPPVLAGTYPDGSPILWVQQPDGTCKVIASNAPDPDGLVVFPLRDDGTLGTATFHDAKAGSPFYIAFLNHRPDTFVLGYAVGDGCAIATIDGGGNINVGPLVKIDTSPGLPSELCWLAVSPDDRFVYATNFGYSYISSYRIDGARLSIAKDPACPKVPGDGTARGLNTTVTSGPSRYLDYAGWRLSLPDLRECLEAGGLRDAA